MKSYLEQLDGYVNSISLKKHYKETLNQRGEPGKTPVIGLTDQEIVKAFDESRTVFCHVMARFETVKEAFQNGELNMSLIRLLRVELAHLERSLQIKHKAILCCGDATPEAFNLPEDNPKEFRKRVFQMITEEVKAGAKETQAVKAVFQRLEPLFIDDFGKTKYWIHPKSLLDAYNKAKNRPKRRKKKTQ